MFVGPASSLRCYSSKSFDVSGRAAESGGPEWPELLERHGALVRREFNRFHGRTAAGSLAAAFDGPIRAIRCAQRLLIDFRELGIQIRAGAHTGECEFENGRLSGDAVTIAEQIHAKAAPGEILVSGTIKDLVPGSGIEFEDQQHAHREEPALLRVISTAVEPTPPFQSRYSLRSQNRRTARRV